MNTKPVWLGLLLGAALVTGASCTVDKSGIVFDDKPFEDGDSDGSDSVDDGSGGGGGEPGTGGSPGGTGGSVGGGCENGELTCDSRQVQMCVFGQVIDVGGECSNACIDGVCGGVCVPTTTECQGVTHLRTCSAAGEWTVPAVCENQACADGACVGECAPGAYSCRGTNNGMPVQCNDQGAWVDLRPSNCINDACTNGVCTGTCANGETQCVGPGFNNWQECQAGSWVNQTACQYVCTGNACGGACVPGDKRCKEATLQSCSFGGAWVTDQTCPFVCEASPTPQCGGECIPNDSRCAPGDPLVIQTCTLAGK
ncbi:MAG TPA: hypothetical protein VLC09_10480, partial [Polyangiaceae bacterium]|nr:hypothetical protein [Polyangiaceae bacterium]